MSSRIVWHRQPRHQLPPVIGLGHRKGTGKDSLAESLLLAEEAYLHWHPARQAFADRLKEAAHRLFKYAGLQPGPYYDEHRDEREAVLPALGKTPRQIWIEFGNAMRAIHPDIWVDQVMAIVERRFDLGVNCIVITDVRFPNEVAAIRRHGGLLLRVDRAAAPRQVDGADDVLADLPDEAWDGIVVNDGSLIDLAATASAIVTACTN